MNKDKCIRPEKEIKGPFELSLLLLKLKTENWKHCSKIIFKCVKSTVGPIFNIFNAWTVLLQYVNSIATMHKQQFLSLHNKFTVHALKKKKIKRTET